MPENNDNIWLQNPDGLFFDWDGTLVDSLAFLESAHNHVLQSFGKEAFPEGAFKPFFGKPREEIYNTLYGENNAAEACQRFEQFVMASHKTMLNPIEGAEELLETAHDAGIILGVVSNKKPEFVNAEIDHFGWRKFFKSVVGAGEAGNDKPSPDPLLLGVKKTGLDPKKTQIWYAGDTKTDLLCAKSCQAPLIFMGWGESIPARDIETHPTKTIQNLSEFTNIILQNTEKRLKNVAKA